MATRILEVDVYTRLNRILRRQGYHVIGLHSAVKKCHWTHAALVEKRFCYKCKFYGIESHRCIQMTPATLWCWNRCLHCWRLRPSDRGLLWDDTRLPRVDDPEFIADQAIKEHRRIVSGYKGRKGVDPKMVEEALNPKHVAISLSGEPTLYPRLGELIEVFHRKGLTTFLVTRGVRPDVIEGLEEEPSQLYVSLEAWNEEMYKRLNEPLVPNAWKLTLRTLELLPTLSSPTVIRITLIKGLNMSDKDVEGFAKLIEIAQPTYIEVKAYMYVGASRERLRPENMPRHSEVREFAKKLAEKTGYPIRSESIPSRVVLLSKLKKPIRHGKGCPEGWRTKEIGDEYSGEYGRYLEEY